MLTTSNGDLLSSIINKWERFWVLWNFGTLVLFYKALALLPTFFLSQTMANRFHRVLIRLQRIHNFWCSMLVFTPFAQCFVTLRGTFMRFLELTYWQDVIVPVSYFLLFLCFRSDTQEIFSELDKTKARSLILPGSFQRTKEEAEWGHEGPTH
jgi:hypothetical protein